MHNSHIWIPNFACYSTFYICWFFHFSEVTKQQRRRKVRQRVKKHRQKTPKQMSKKLKKSGAWNCFRKAKYFLHLKNQKKWKSSRRNLIYLRTERRRKRTSPKSALQIPRQTKKVRQNRLSCRKIQTAAAAVMMKPGSENRVSCQAVELSEAAYYSDLISKDGSISGIVVSKL